MKKHPLKEYREKHKLSQRQLAEQLSTDPAVVSGWETGQHRIRFASALAVSGSTSIPLLELLEANPEMKHTHPLRTWRWNNGVSQRQLAHALGCDRTAVSMWESGKRRPHIQWLKKIEDITGLTHTDFLNEKE